MTPGTDPASLRARTRRLDADPDSVAVAGSDGLLWDGPGISLAGRGRALDFTVDRTDPTRCASHVSDMIGAISCDDAIGQPGSGVVALGAWPFNPGEPGRLTVPAVVVGRSDDGTRWVTTVCAVSEGGDDEAAHDAMVAALLDDLATHAVTTLAGFSTAEPPSPHSFSVDAVPPPHQWCDSVAAVCDKLDTVNPLEGSPSHLDDTAGGVVKVVMAREVRVTADADLPVDAVLARLRRTFPDALRFSIDGFIGASPELLVARTGDIVRCHPMAGTAPRSGDPAADARLGAALLASEKNRIEHQHTIDLVHDSLIGFCSYVDAEAEPSLVAMNNVQHLGTRVEGRLSAPAASVVELVTVLHPTPAVCGRPRDAAMALIDEFEHLDRGRYAGPVGWVDSRGNGAWAVGIRAAEIDGPVARVMAGVGVVSDSDPQAELAETRAKLQAILGAIIRP